MTEDELYSQFLKDRYPDGGGVSRKSLQFKVYSVEFNKKLKRARSATMPINCRGNQLFSGVEIG